MCSYGCLLWGFWRKLTNWGQETHICVSKNTIIDSHNGLSPERCQAIIWTNAGVLLIGTLSWTSFTEILNKIHTFAFIEMHLKTSSVKWQPFCLSLNVLTVTMGPSCISSCTGIIFSIKQCIVTVWMGWYWLNYCVINSNQWLNSLASKRCGSDFKSIIF